MKSHMEIKVNGKKVNSNNLEKVIQKSIEKDIKESLKKDILNDLKKIGISREDLNHIEIKIPKIKDKFQICVSLKDSASEELKIKFEKYNNG